MSVKRVSLWSRVKQILTPQLVPVKINRTVTLNKKRILFPLLAMLILFSCKKAEDSMLPMNPQNSTGDVKSESCGTTEYLRQQLAADPGLQSRMDAIEENTQMKIASGSSQYKSGTSLITIPVVVHVVYNLSEQNISDAQIQSQIDALTEDFTGTNADAINIPAAFQPFASNPNVEFVLAKRDPNGNATNGITRTNTSVTSFSSNNYVKFASYGGHDAWPTDQYLNIWVCNLGLCGYASYPGSAAAVDGVVVKYNCFGRIGNLQTNYNKGRTATHEILHWLNVHHIWGDATCGDDLVDDTPIQENANYDHPVFPLLSPCSINSNGDMFMNYMDYTADDVRNIMTQGQTDRVLATLNGVRASLLTSLGATPPATTTACNVPDGMNVTSVTTNSAILNWTSTGAVSYNVRYKPTSSTNWISTSAASTSLAISGLNASTVYEYQVASVCSGGETSAYSNSATFTTQSAITVCNIPAGLNVTQITKNSATLNWLSTGALSYKIRYKKVSASTWTTVSTTGTTFYVSGLSSSTNYEFQVMSICSSTSFSAYSSSGLFTTLAVNKKRNT